MARDRDRKHRHHDRDKHPKRKHDRDPKPKPGGGGTPGKTVTEQLKEKSTQSGQDAMNAAPMSYQEATEAALYSTGPGEVVSYDYQRTGTYADEYNAQQQVEVQGQTLSGAGQGGFI